MTDSRLADESIAALRSDGVTPLRSVVSAAELESVAAAIERDLRSPGPFFHGYRTDDGGLFHGNLRLWEHDDACKAFCFSSGLPAIAQQCFASRKVNLLYDQLFVKEAGTDNPTRWHNDQPYWAIRGQQVLSIWVALDRTTLKTGALEFIRGSHLWNRWFQPEPFGETAAHGVYEINPEYEPIPDIDANRDDYDIVSWDLEPGDAFLFHGLTVHGAPGNSSSQQRRRGYAVRYTGDDVVYDTRPGTNVHLRNKLLADGQPLDSAQYPVVLRTNI